MNTGPIGSVLFDGPGWIAPPALGSPAGAAALLSRRRRHAFALPPDLLSALVAYLRSAPTLAAALTPGFGQGGFGALGFGGTAQVYDEMALADAFPPFVLVFGYSETLPGETSEEQPVEVDLIIRSDGLDQARTVGQLVKNAIDSVNFNPNSVLRDLFAFAGGTEVYQMRQSSKPERLPGVAKGGVYAYREDIAYTFYISPEQ